MTGIEARFGERPTIERWPEQRERLRPREREAARIFDALARGLATDPRGRWPGMSELLRALEGTRSRRRSVVVAAALATAALTLALAGRTDDAVAPSEARCVVATLPLTARVVAADTWVDAGEYDRAATALEHAFELATADANDRAAADAAVRLEFVAGHLLALPREGMRWSRHAAARLEGLDDAALIEARHLLHTGSLLAAQHDDDAAREHFDRALALRERELGVDHPDVAEVYSALGNFAYERDDMLEAREQLGRALAIVEAAPHRNDRALAMLLDDLGNAEQSLGDFATAQARYERSLAIRRTWRSDHPHLVTSWTNLGYLAAERGDVVAAESYYRSRIDAAVASFGEDDPRVGVALGDLGELMIGAARLDEAEALYGRALVVSESAHGSDHGETARCHAGLGRIYLQRGELDRAELEIRRAEAGWRAAFAPDHPVQSRARALLAALARARSD